MTIELAEMVQLQRWQVVKVSDLISAGVLAVNDGYRVRNVELGNSGTPFVRGGDIGDNGEIDTDVADHVLPQFEERLRGKFAEPGDVAFISKGTVGRVGRLRERQPRIVFAPQVCFWRSLNRDAVCPAFLYYVLTSSIFQSQLDAVRTHGSMVADYVSLADQRAFTLPMPPIAVQRAISSVLGSLDDKIEQNRRTGAKLEGLARAVFKAWFVDFEPVKVKAAGATAFPGMPPETFAALPTRLTDSPLGPVPQGWENCRQRVSELERAGTLLIGDGYRAKRSELADIGVPFIRAGNVNGTIITDGAELLGKPAIEKAGVKRSQTWDTVFTSKGTVGRIGLMTPTTGDVVYAPQVCFWRPMNRDALSPFLLHLWMKSESFTGQWMSVKGQTDMADFVSLSDQRAMTMLVPPPRVQRGFDNIVRPVVELMAALHAQSAKLAALRDYLLPRLLSGRVRVEETAESVRDEIRMTIGLAKSGKR